ncbi:MULTISPECIES: glycosyltransferase [unclassified Virgibacillus]|uniref:glycosyltransferase family protein n=1 Tax=unclassified Virgibacillus TaxID=2620237 RepID=UPI000EF548D5|nr:MULTISPECIES: glycosyltransferase [unclassified Virgibacillus]MDY7043829.1 glycosyltransferase [Virgibacillus sp. M23]
MNQKVCMLLCYLPFLDSRIFECEAKSLLNHGFDVTIIAPRKDGLLFHVDGKPFSKQFRDEVFYYQGIKVVTYDSEKRSVNYLSDPLYQLGLKENADFYHAHELNSFTYGKEIKCALRQQNSKKVKLIYDSRQIIPDPFSLKINAETKQRWMRTLRDNLKEVDYIVTVSESIKSWYLSIDPLLSIEVVYNAPSLTPNIKKKNGSNHSLVVAHEGNISKETFEKIKAITDFYNEDIDIHFKIIGGPRYGETLSIPKHLQSRIELFGWINYHDLPKAMEDVDIGLIDLDPSHSLNNAFTMPAKLFSYLNNGIPVIGNKCSDLEKFIRTYYCGMVINKRNSSYLDYIDAIQYLHQYPNEWQIMSKNARNVMQETYSWSHMEKRLLAVYQSLVGNRQPYFLL